MCLSFEYKYYISATRLFGNHYSLLNEKSHVSDSPVFPLQMCRLSQHFGSDQQRDGGEIILRQILSRAGIYDQERRTDRARATRAKRGSRPGTATGRGSLN